jgi:hypothetical protein
VRVADDQIWLSYPELTDATLTGSYDLNLKDPPPGDEYELGQTYMLYYYKGELYGTLGAFWHTEIAQPASGGPLQVGPVSATTPELAVSMTIDVDQYGFTQVEAITGSGHAYLFSATRSLQP